jgi:hypothetical protein
MDAVDIKRSKKGWQLLHRCRTCGTTHTNRVATDTDQPDEIERLIELMRATR